VVVNLSPGTARKEGSGLDLAVAMGVLRSEALPLLPVRRGHPVRPMAGRDTEFKVPRMPSCSAELVGQDYGRDS
jgi:hypothetical protein